MFCEKDCIDTLSAWLVPAIPVAGIIIGFLQWCTNELHRKQDLFDKRYDFYQRLRKVYLAHHGTNPSQFHEATLEPYIEEASFLFGADIPTHIQSFYNATCDDLYVSDESEWHLCPMPDKHFILPFKKYLELK